jgi:hypothetical protein
MRHKQSLEPLEPKPGIAHPLVELVIAIIFYSNCA